LGQPEFGSEVHPVISKKREGKDEDRNIEKRRAILRKRGPSVISLLPILLLSFAVTLLACDREKDARPTAARTKAPDASDDAAATKPSLPPDAGPPPTIDSARAFQYVKEIVAFGPRPLGSTNHKKVEDYLLAHLKGDDVENDTFIADTPEGKFPVHNIVAKFPGTKEGIIVIASHYDTNYPLRKTSFVGANDGASSSALLLEFANQLRGKTRDGYSVWLVWDDAEEAMQPDTEVNFLDDSLYGIRHLAEKWEADGTMKKIKAFLLADMIGDADLNVDRDGASTPWLEDVVYEAATRLGYQSHFFVRTLGGMEDDHVPFLKRGVPSADIIDFDYGYNNVFWHTTQDTVDKLSPKSLEIVGATVLETVRILDKMDPLPPK
jgi:glutaminyl-peptide cyclotransferase